jgi:hypothetical protein
MYRRTVSSNSAPGPATPAGEAVRPKMGAESPSGIGISCMRTTSLADGVPVGVLVTMVVEVVQATAAVRTTLMTARTFISRSSCLRRFAA